MLHLPNAVEQDTIDLLLEHYRCELVPLRLSKTMLDKATIDARAPLRALFRQSGLIEFGAIGQGQQYKVQLQLPLVSGVLDESRTVSFYRPETKQGDPRIWIERLGNVAAPNDLLLFAFSDASLLIIVVKGDAGAIIRNVRGRLPSRFEERGRLESVIRKLQGMLAPLKSRWVRTRRSGPTGVGFTLETMLGIRANVSQLADVDGVELKAYRRGAVTGQGKLVSLFAKTPQWIDSRKGTGLLKDHGYVHVKTGRLQLYCSIDTTRNTLGWCLDLLPDQGRIEVNHRDVTTCLYSLTTLSQRLNEKHPATLFVKATARGAGSNEEFCYDEVTLCREPSFSNFVDLIDADSVCLDFTLSEKIGGGCRDHGYLWRIRESQISNLYAYKRLLT